MEETKSEYKLEMGVLNGLILGLIGLLVLITPLATSMSTEQIKVDMIAGGVLLTGGLVSLFWGLRRRKTRQRPGTQD